MWTGGIVVSAPGLDQDLGLPEIIEDFPRQQLVAELGVEALAVTILPCASRLDIERLHTDALQPITERWRKEYGGLQVDQAKRTKELEKENQRLRRAVSDLTLDNQILKEVAQGKF